MDEIYLLWFLSISMLVGSFLSGLVPMAFKLSDNKSRLLALLGSGILVGTALAIIIPEGIDSLYGQETSPIKHHATSSKHSSLDESSNDEVSQAEDTLQKITSKANKTWTIGISLVVGFILMLFIDQFSIYQSTSDDASGEQRQQFTKQGKNFITEQGYTLASQEDDIDTAYQEEVDHQLAGGDAENLAKIPTESETQRITSPFTDPSKQAFARGHDITIANSSGGQYTGVPMVPTNPNKYYSHASRPYIPSRSKNAKVTPTLGLVIHAAADGIALGAAATTSHRDVEMIIFFAIMLHKAPAAFSLVVLLLHRGLKYSNIRRHLLAFSLSAPIAAIVTYYGLSQSGKEALRRSNATGIAMLFSAGTFLFVATVHVLPDLVHNKLLKPKEMLFLVGGAFLPLILAQTV